MSDGKYQIFVRVDTETGKQFERLIERFTTPVTVPTKTDVIELVIREAYEKYVLKGGKL